MPYIYRELLEKIKGRFSAGRTSGCILSGIVGCGKTTLVEKLLEESRDSHEIFSFTGDDVIFRRTVADDSNFIHDFIRSKTSKNALVFVDEVQKTEEVFDALKIAFDKGNISFIVSGSNPAFLSTVAKKRLQRRAEQIFMLPLALSEVFIDKGLIGESSFRYFDKILREIKSCNEIQIPQITLTNNAEKLIDTFFLYGGLPLAYLRTSAEEKLSEIRLTVERGFDLMSVDNSSVAEIVRLELAKLNSKEFTYKYVLTKTRLKRRDEFNKVIDGLINHGYLIKKKLSFLPEDKSSYLSVFSYVDPGIVTYLTGNTAKNIDSGDALGSQVESYVHARLIYYSLNSAFKSELTYYKPYTQDEDGDLKYLPGEIDFIFKQGKRVVPIEVKSSKTISSIKVPLLEKFIKDNNCSYGIVLYGGVPILDKKVKIIYWPYWMI
jgi:predicted AAA+ superfamily ATPase